MYRREKTLREDRYNHEKKTPSFSSTLLDKIYRSIDEGDIRTEDLKFYREPMGKKQGRGSGKNNRATEEEAAANLRRACLIEKLMDKKVSEKVGTGRREYLAEPVKSQLQEHDHDHDVLFFSSTSSSSDSSSGGFSSSDTESMYGLKSKFSCSLPSRPRPVRTGVSARPERSEKKQRALFHEQRELHVFDDCHYSSATGDTPKGEEAVTESKSRARKIYANLKKVKQPISPGGRLANFLNSLFTTGNTKKTKNLSSTGRNDDASGFRKSKSVQESTCSSASSFSRSCLSKKSPSSREKQRNGVKRTVRFCPVSVIVDEDCRPCGHKCLYEEEDASIMPMRVSTAWKKGRSPTRTDEEELKSHVMEKTRRVEEAAREFLKNYHQNQRKNELIMRDFRGRYDEDEYEGDDAASCSSSDLFELDHLVAIGNDRYCEELPVYETTHVVTNKAIANGLML
ncbi:hypothetical protein CJ030_MR3G020212 [Morella rubra]|uniref:Protein BIG GRAIN 1-like B n=1 Tax=Morella rubra TaxID=262757 RepID=A0A6A1W4C3_9ROSI|nr:hypothetical protein CJ030_MR3G020211 [Morella rubra]KAB1219965.1 hypothetical protein CJ030_MR3G020212 [Morella rubra]